jgi:hypothetical protein
LIVLITNAHQVVFAKQKRLCFEQYESERPKICNWG